MPLLKGKSEVGHNIMEMPKAGHPRDVAVAAALRTARMAKGGHAPKTSASRQKPFKMRFHSGPIHSSVAGRTDHLPMTVRSGSYVIPADIVGASGEGNTIAGFQHMRRLFGGTPYNGGSGLYGQGDKGPYLVGKADGGEADGDDPGVPIVAAGGEYVIDPDGVRRIGNGDLKTGHAVLDEFVKRMRSKTISTLKKLPGPAKN